MYDFGIDLGASYTKVACLRRVPGIDSYADPIFNCGAAIPLEVNAAYWYPHKRQRPSRSFLVPSVVLWDRKGPAPNVLIGASASQMYKEIRDTESRHRQAHPHDHRRVAIYPFFNWKRRFITEPDNPCTPQPTPENPQTWSGIATEFLGQLRKSFGETYVPAESALQRQRFEIWMNDPRAHTRLCLPLTAYAKANRAAIENRIRNMLKAAGWPVSDGRKVVSWEGTANLLGRITRGRNRMQTDGATPDVEGVFAKYGFSLGRPRKGWTCMAVDVGHYTTDVAVYRYQSDDEEYRNPAAMDDAIFTCSEEVGVASHLDVLLNECLSQRGLPARDAISLLDFKQLWTLAAIRRERPTNAANMVGVGQAASQSFIADVTSAYAAFADAVSRAVAASIAQCEEAWSGRPDSTPFPKLRVNVIYLSGGVMEAPDLRDMFRHHLHSIPACADSVFDSPDPRKGPDATLMWNSRLRSACAAGAVSVLGDSRG
jgi:hypothetical protein